MPYAAHAKLQTLTEKRLKQKSFFEPKSESLKNSGREAKN
jgi:hypothetical protein